MSAVTDQDPTTQQAPGRSDAVEPPTRPLLLVAGREIRVKLTDRNFILSTVFTLVLIVAIFGVQAFLVGLGSSPEHRVAVTGPDGAQVVEQAETVLQAELPDGTVEAVEVADAQAGEALVQSEEADALLTEEGGAWTLAADGSPPGELASALQEAVQARALAANAESLGSSVEELLAGTELTTVDLAADDGESELVVFIAGLLFGMLFYVASLLFGLSIAQSVVEEKQSRIVEILTAVIPVQQLLAGKVLGNTVMAFAQMLLIVGVALIGVSFTDFDSFLPMLAEPLLWYLPFFVAGFVALACVWAAAGAMASRSEDLQTTTMPLTLVLVAVFLVATSVDGIWRVVGSYVPVMSTFLMPIRLLEGEAGWWEPVVALAVTVAFSWLTIRVGAMLYRRALLQQGRVTVKQALRLTE